MKNRYALVSTLALLCSAGLIFPEPAFTAVSEDRAILQSVEKAPGHTGPSTAKQGDVKTAQPAAKPDPAAERKKMAQNLLNRCYQEALQSELRVKTYMLLDIAQSMAGIDRKRAILIYEQAFNAALELQGSENATARAMNQSNIARMVYGYDPEKALELALRIESMPGSVSQANIRLGALGDMVVRLADKDPERAFGIVREEMAHGDCLKTLIVPMAVALQKKRPELAETLYIEAIHQFEKPVTNAPDFINFIDMASSLFDLNRALTVQAVEIILKAIDNMADHPPEVDVRLETFDGKTKTSYDGVREYAISKVLPVVRRMDPERAKGLEEKFSASRGLLPKSSGTELGSMSEYSMASPAKPSTPTPDSSSAQNPSAPPPALGTPTYSRMTLIHRDAVGAPTKPPVDFSARRAAEQARMESANQVFQIGRLAREDPEAAQAQLKTLAPGPSRVKATATMALALIKKDPEQAKSLLNEAATATEKLSDPYDQAECDGLIARGFLQFDQDRAQQILKEALKLADQLVQEEEERKSNPKPPAGVVTTFRSPQPLFSTLLGTLARLNIDDAMARAEKIKDKETKVRALVQIANALMSQK
ncbi:MAG: hypothetical protein LAO31_16545 [Acidobacteriia bacterium]|nr:hypothetical protein [Terriglobia bacterium]